MITFEDAKNLKYGDILIHTETGHRWKVNGQVKLWKRDLSRIRVPLKHGLYTYDYIDESIFDENGICDFLTKES